MSESTTYKTVHETIELLQRFYESPSLAHTNAIPLLDAALPPLRTALDDIEWTEKGLAEWRDAYQRAAQQAEAARATARVAITHLSKVLNECRTAHDQQKADAEARDWLASIGA